MNIFEAIILGFVQGLTEFLPVSSTAHLEISKSLFDMQFHGGLAIDIVVHAGSAVAILIFFIQEFFKKPKIAEISTISQKQASKIKSIFSLSFMGAIVFASLPALFVYKVFEEKIDQFFHGSQVPIAICLFITGIFLFLLEFLTKKQKLASNASEPSKILPFTNVKGSGIVKSWVKALFIGCFQALAILPGISRSGFTIGAGLILKIDKEQAVKFSFVMGFVAISGAVVLKAKDIIDLTNEISLSALIVSFIASLISSYFALRLILWVVKVRKMKYFGMYCFAIALITLLSQI